ncbi:mesoderm induction early response protein 1 isoform X2 [Octopus sinensis]|uniref:Mesoderm induction early response protein 1 isoform X2 n=1 Tax=Octopus sinensis TaxID=2607531 RepID=A0A6P7T0P6_9MOLL|nr:mesoderm induction early response protein 1 isoform X2 [Octopus sinensis]
MKMAEGNLGGSDSSSPDNRDQDFAPTRDMMKHEGYDDERTLEEEEAMSGGSCSNELDELQKTPVHCHGKGQNDRQNTAFKEGEMPLENLLAMYGCNSTTPETLESSCFQDTRSSSEEDILISQNLTLDKEEIARDLLSNSDEDDKETNVNDLLDSVSSSQTARLLRSNSQTGSEDDDPDDYDYQPENEEDWKKVIQVGHDYQAQVPEGLSTYGDAPAYENEDRLLWDPTKLEDSEVCSYLQQFQAQSVQSGVNNVPTGTHVRDDEQALYLLLQCGHNTEEALRRRKMQAVSPTENESSCDMLLSPLEDLDLDSTLSPARSIDPMSLWSEEECRNFENGLRTYGKDFHLIQLNKVRTRSVGELVQFYYLWKKTERHDIFANKNRIEKKKYALHPGITDYMDRFLDQDQDSPSPATTRDRSSSPNFSMLIYGDQKRHQLKPTIDVDNLTNFQSIGSLSVLDNSSSTKVLDSAVDHHNVDTNSNGPGKQVISRLERHDDVSDDTLEPPSAKKCKLDLKSEIEMNYSAKHFLESNLLNPLTLTEVSKLSNDNTLASGESLHFSQPTAESVAQ